MATRTKQTQQQPRFMLRSQLGDLIYICRGCAYQCHHVAHLMQHLQGCQAGEHRSPLTTQS